MARDIDIEKAKASQKWAKCAKLSTRRKMGNKLFKLNTREIAKLCQDLCD